MGQQRLGHCDTCVIPFHHPNNLTEDFHSHVIGEEVETQAINLPDKGKGKILVPGLSILLTLIPKAHIRPCDICPQGSQTVLVKGCVSQLFITATK